MEDAITPAERRDRLAEAFAEDESAEQAYTEWRYSPHAASITGGLLDENNRLRALVRDLAEPLAETVKHFMAERYICMWCGEYALPDEGVTEITHKAGCMVPRANAALVRAYIKN